MSRHIRYQPAITRNSDENISEDHWFKQFEKSLQKSAVQPKKQQSLFDQINNIMNRTSKHSSVEAVVDDMKERSGLTAYLKRAETEEPQEMPATKKVATDVNNVIHKKVKMPLVIEKYPPVLKTLQNCIRDSKGNLPLPAIIERVRSIHNGDISDAKDWDADDLMYLVSQMNLDAKKNNPDSYQDYSNLGGRDVASDSEIDPSNNDAFHALMPSKI
jgi:hypothetical protein